MQAIESIVSAFAVSAESMLSGELAELHRSENEMVFSGKLERLKLRNQHLEKLKERLDAELQSVLNAASVTTPIEKTEIERKLRAVADDTVHDYMNTVYR